MHQLIFDPLYRSGHPPPKVFRRHHLPVEVGYRAFPWASQNQSNPKPGCGNRTEPRLVCPVAGHKSPAFFYSRQRRDRRQNRVRQIGVSAEDQTTGDPQHFLPDPFLCPWRLPQLATVRQKFWQAFRGASSRRKLLNPDDPHCGPIGQKMAAVKVR